MTSNEFHIRRNSQLYGGFRKVLFVEHLLYMEQTCQDRRACTIVPSQGLLPLQTSAWAASYVSAHLVFNQDSQKITWGGTYDDLLPDSLNSNLSPTAYQMQPRIMQLTLRECLFFSFVSEDNSVHLTGLLGGLNAQWAGKTQQMKFI